MAQLDGCQVALLRAEALKAKAIQARNDVDLAIATAASENHPLHQMWVQKVSRRRFICNAFFLPLGMLCFTFCTLVVFGAILKRRCNIARYTLCKISPPAVCIRFL